ncbi:MAG TPA: DUF5808 domain-containing protein [Candidatus Dormibacteraeota bacterium]|nr:DUF5808 domain-containing protein [Candidatus Dormibacteraeota bacterium]
MRRLVRFVTFGLVAAAIATELAKPALERTWQGKVFGIVPYDFRPPTWERIRDAYWNPESDRLFSDRVFGVGWALNLYRAKTILEEAFRGLMGTQEATPIRMSVQTGGSAEPTDVFLERE